MSGSEEFAKFNPGIRDTLYIPDEHMTQDIIASTARRRLAQTQALGAIQADAARAPYEAGENAYKSYVEGRKRGLAEEQQKQEMGQRAQQSQDAHKAQDIQNQRNQGSLSEEQKQREFLDQDSGGGKTRRQALAESDYGQAIKAPKNAQEEHDLRMREIDHQLRAADAQAAYSGYALQDAKDQKLRGDIKDELAGIYSNPALTPQQQQQATQQIMAKYQGHLPPALLNAYATGAQNAVVASRNQAAAAAQLTAQGTDTYRDMSNKTQAAQGAVANLQHLNQVRNTYANNLRFNVGGIGASAGENSVGSDQRKEFADTLDAMGHHDLAEDVRGAGISSVQSRMDRAIQALGTQVKSQWDVDKRTIHPSQQQRPEIGQTDQAIQTLSQIGQPGSEKNNLDLTGSGMGAGRRSSNASFLTGGQGGGQPPPGGAPQGGGIMPAGYNMTQPPAANAQRKSGAMPNGGMVQLPGYNGGQQQPPQTAPGQAAPMPSAFPYNFSKYRINPPQDAQGTPLQ